MGSDMLAKTLTLLVVASSTKHPLCLFT